MLGILIAILTPTVRSAIDLTETTVCMNNLRQIYLAIAMYAQDHNGYWLTGSSAPIGTTYICIPWDGFNAEKKGIGFLYDQYLDNLDAFYCPARAKKVSAMHTKIYFDAPGRPYCYSDYLTIIPDGTNKLEKLKDEIPLRDRGISGEFPALFDPPGPHRRNYNKLYGDGSVRLEPSYQ
jgi:type II secretory pathway pseudopilin PulG